MVGVVDPRLSVRDFSGLHRPAEPERIALPQLPHDGPRLEELGESHAALFPARRAVKRIVTRSISGRRRARRRGDADASARARAHRAWRSRRRAPPGVRREVHDTAVGRRAGPLDEAACSARWTSSVTALCVSDSDSTSCDTVVEPPSAPAICSSRRCCLGVTPPRRAASSERRRKRRSSARNCAAAWKRFAVIFALELSQNDCCVSPLVVRSRFAERS